MIFTQNVKSICLRVLNLRNFIYYDKFELAETSNIRMARKTHFLRHFLQRYGTCYKSVCNLQHFLGSGPALNIHPELHPPWKFEPFLISSFRGRVSANLKDRQNMKYEKTALQVRIAGFTKRASFTLFARKTAKNANMQKSNPPFKREWLAG